MHFHNGHQVKLLLSGQPFFDELLRLIGEARVFIHLQTYILDYDKTGAEVIDALKVATKRGVMVMVVADGYGTRLPDEVISDMQQAGIAIRMFSPLRGVKIGRRLHHKIVLNETGDCLIGGINIADKYKGTVQGKPWLDYALLINGQVSKQVFSICNFIWKRKQKVAGKLLLNAPVHHENGVSVALAQNDWFRNKKEISRLYRRAFAEAETEVWIVASYFLPSRVTRKAMRIAAKRGVKIRVLLSGISDVRFVKQATCFLYDWMFRYQFEIFEWKESVLHGKLMLVDNKWCTIGSYNINKLSDFGSIELNVVVKDTAFTQDVKKVVNAQIAEGAEKVEWATYSRENNFLKQLYNWFCYNLVRLSLVLFLWLSEEQDRRRSNPGD